MRYLFLLLIYISLQGAGFWTLSGLTKANIYVSNELSLIKPETIESIKAKMTTSLEANGIVTGKQDSAILMVSLEEISDDEAYFIYVKLSLGEEVATFRDDKSKTFALTYDSSDFIETDDEELDRDVLESIDGLLLEFFELYEEDSE
ncbi:MAG: hypothetical protein U9Q40_08115 [Campylobacterota bacterium]|nr:hypothetical protein [Campylobacterota bacterium]